MAWPPFSIGYAPPNQDWPRLKLSTLTNAGCVCVCCVECGQDSCANAAKGCEYELKEPYSPMFFDGGTVMNVLTRGCWRHQAPQFCHPLTPPSVVAVSLLCISEAE